MQAILDKVMLGSRWLLAVFFQRQLDGRAPDPSDLRTATAAARLVAAYTDLVERDFRRAAGVAAYARALMQERAASALTEEGRVTDAIYAAGYSAPSRFYDNNRERLGMNPSAWANGGKGVTINWAVVPTSTSARQSASSRRSRSASRARS